VPDLAAAARQQGKVGSADEEVRAELGDKIPKLVLWICVE